MSTNRVSTKEGISTSEHKNTANSHPQLKPTSIDEAPHISEDTEPESGWAAVAKSIQEIDEQKIKDCKEDIDTILVFAGLYSAVLSAFLAESYQSLQPDPTVIMIALLGQVVMQTHSYSFNSGYLNSTVLPLDVSSVQQFTPSLAAKRVNVLWFTSLALSLISASLGILVKQWLREYLSGEYVSPQARLRIRQFRTAGLSDWHVFAIAALLPLLLQLALALFFIGLCFFTLDVHHTVGYTTVPLVAGWALPFAAASCATLLSPRCPYKILLFREVMQHLRTSLFHSIWLFKGSPTIPEKLSWPVTSSWNWWCLNYNEEDAAKDPRKDVDILVAIDASQTDDQLVMKMCNALKEMHVSPDSIFAFVLRVIDFRLESEPMARPLPSMLDLSQLSVQTCTILMDTVADILAREIRKSPVLLVARLPCRLSDKAAAALTLCFESTHTARVGATCEFLFKGVPREDRDVLCLHLQVRLRSVLLCLDAF